MPAQIPELRSTLANLTLHRADDLGQQPAPAFDLSVQDQQIRQCNRLVTRCAIPERWLAIVIPLDAGVRLDRCDGPGDIPGRARVQANRRVYQSLVVR